MPMHLTLMSIRTPLFMLAVFAYVLACARSISPSIPATGVVLRIVDSSRAGEPLPGVHVRLRGPSPAQTVIGCSDSAPTPLIRWPAVAPGRYQLSVARIGYESQRVEVTVVLGQADTATVAMRRSTRDLENAILTGPLTPPCAARPNER
jgi:hypothetical protein